MPGPMASSSRSWSRILAQGVLAGIGAGLVMDLYLWVTTLLPAHGSMEGFWQAIASTVLGKAAVSMAGAAWVGLAIQLAAAIAWAGGYAYLAMGQPLLNRRWVVSGIAFGIVVYVVMQLVLLAGNAFKPAPTPQALLNAVVANACFFGLPVAYIVMITRPRGVA